ncbi:alpha-glucan water dikinase [Carex littledalei]|uniref:Alpha-glucan water dikinase n=1 Tax=Carex littledalei TaxID=544730 RepID=A0A833R077_9POAL|nr:alpha-glucan water dikinase [Carex littledalei]
MDEEEKVVLDYSTDPLIMDQNFCHTILCGVVNAGSAIEDLYGSPQDIEGVVKDGKIFVVQTRPQMSNLCKYLLRFWENTPKSVKTRKYPSAGINIDVKIHHHPLYQDMS